MRFLGFVYHINNLKISYLLPDDGYVTVVIRCSCYIPHFGQK